MEPEVSETANLSPIGKKSLNLIEFSRFEKVIWEIRKHPFWLLLVWLTGLFIAVAVMAVTILAIWGLDGDRLGTGSDFSGLKGVAAVVGFIIIVFVIIATLIAAFIYRRNLLIVTSEKIAEITYVSLFNRKITQLSLEDIQDVSVEQIGIFPRVFNYGTLIIETAGERENVTFTYTPLPHNCARKIINVRDDFETEQRRQSARQQVVAPPPPVEPPVAAEAPTELPPTR